MVNKDFDKLTTKLGKNNGEGGAPHQRARIHSHKLFQHPEVAAGAPKG